MTKEEFLSGEAFSESPRFVGYAFKRTAENAGEIINIIDGEKYCDVVTITASYAMIKAPLFGHAALRFEKLKCWRTGITVCNNETTGN